MAKKIFSILVTASIVLLIVVYFMDGKDQFVLSVEIDQSKVNVNTFIAKPPLEYNLIDGFVSLKFDEKSKQGQGVLSLLERQEQIDYSYDSDKHSGEFSLKGIRGSFSTTIVEANKKSIVETQVEYQVDGMFAKLFQSLITKVIEQKLAEDHLRFSKQFQVQSNPKI
ncbi:MAG: hypothetical protein KC646_01270 [Candidatus Cloacimonetes bacterium]|nr:hypothetical protein [Candidatus Cloacimonadota bacterium]